MLFKKFQAYYFPDSPDLKILHRSEALQELYAKYDDKLPL